MQAIGTALVLNDLQQPACVLMQQNTLNPRVLLRDLRSQPSGGFGTTPNDREN